jgi:hypothetical protein
MGSLASIFDLVETPAWELHEAPPEFIETTKRMLHRAHLRQCRGEEVRAFDGDVLPSGPAPFIEYCFRHEGTDEPIQNAAHHEAWQTFFNENDFGVILAPVGHGKTQQLLGRVLYMLGKDPTLRIAVVCATDDQARERVVQLRQLLQENERIREVFPDLSLDPDAKLTEHEFTVQRKTTAKDPSVRAYGVGSKALQGARLDILLMDDVCDRDNTNTVELRSKMVEWFDAVAFSRQTPGMRFRVWVIGTPWHYEDLLHVLKERPAFASQVWSAVLNPDDPQEEWRTLWEGVYTPEHARFLWANSTPHAFARKQLCRVRDDQYARFRREWIAKCLRLGAGRELVDGPPSAYWQGPLLPCITGVDLGVGQDEDHDLSVLFTIALMPDRKRLVVDIQSGRWTGPEIVQRIIRTARRYRSIVVVENNAAQDFIRQFAEDADDLPIEPFNTGRNKHDEDFGIETLGVELRAGRWVIPASLAGEATDPEIKLLIKGMLNYAPKDHTADHLMAMWIARERARTYLAESAGALADVGVR